MKSENIMTNLLERMNKEQQFHDKILQEALSGKRDFWILNRAGQYSLYPAGHKTAEFVMHKDPDKYVKLGYLRILKTSELKEVLTLRALLHEIQGKYAVALKKAFEMGDKDGGTKNKKVSGK